MSDAKTENYRYNKRLKQVKDEGSIKNRSVTVAQLVAYLSSFNPNDEVVIPKGSIGELTSRISIIESNILTTSDGSYYMNNITVPTNGTKRVLIIKETSSENL
jgi:hypothetical protein